VDSDIAAGFLGLADLARAGGEVIAGLRPEALSDASLAPEVPGDRVVEASVELVEALGADLVVHVNVGDAKAAARFTPRSRVQLGDVVKMAVDTRAVHLFHPETGRSLRKASPS
jgi:multiple sugar transport system ATP-binding protein